MKSLRTQIDENGRILIPAQIRKEYNVQQGDTFVIRIIDGEIHLISLAKALKEIQDMVQSHNEENISLVEELIKARRSEAEKE